MNSHQKKKRHVNKEDVNTVPNDDVKEIEDNNSEARSLKCSQCTKEFVNHDKLEKHIRRKHIDDNNPRMILEDKNKIHRFNCNKCTKAFVDSDRLRKHIRRKHPDDNTLIETIQKSETLNLNCSQCSKVYAYHDKLEKHKHRKHSKESMLKTLLDVERKPGSSKCPECSKIVSNSHLKRHMRRQHLDPTKKFQCEECSKFFYTNYERKKHQIIHKDAGEKEYFVCDQCFSIFTRKYYLKRHKDFCSEVQHDRVGCNLCDKKFSSKDSLRQHKRAVHDGLKNKKCHVCRRRFFSKKHLVQHTEALHLVVTDNKCPICPMTYFSLKRTLAKHLSSYHSNFVVPGHASTS